MRWESARLARSIRRSALRKPPKHPSTAFSKRRRPAAANRRPRTEPVVLHVGAGSEAKRWPVEHWRELAGRISVELGRRVVLVGSADDRRRAREIVGGRPWPGLLDWTGRLTVVELAALLRRAALLVGADSGPAHLAAAVGAPVVVLFSGTNRRRQWQPRGERVEVLGHRVACRPCHRSRCGLADHPCMRRIRPEEVLAAVRRQLDPKRRTSGTGRPLRKSDSRANAFIDIQ